MTEFLIKAFLKFFVAFANIGLAPINSIMTNLFPDLTTYMNNFATVLNTYVAPCVGWFIALIPPHTKALIGVYLGAMVSLYAVSLTVQTTLKIFKLIQNIKIW